MVVIYVQTLMIFLYQKWWGRTSPHQMGTRTNDLLLTKKMEVGKKKKMEREKNSNFIVEKLDRHHSNHGVKINLNIM